MSMPLSSSAPTFVCPVKCSRRPLATFLAFCGGWGSTMLPSGISNMLDFLSTVGLCPLLHHREQASPRSEKKFGRSELCRRKFPKNMKNDRTSGGYSFLRSQALVADSIFLSSGRIEQCWDRDRKLRQHFSTSSRLRITSLWITCFDPSTGLSI